MNTVNGVSRPLATTKPETSTCPTCGSQISREQYERPSYRRELTSTSKRMTSQKRDVSIESFTPR